MRIFIKLLTSILFVSLASTSAFAEGDTIHDLVGEYKGDDCQVEISAFEVDNLGAGLTLNIDNGKHKISVNELEESILNDFEEGYSVSFTKQSDLLDFFTQTYKVNFSKPGDILSIEEKASFEFVWSDVCGFMELVK